MPKISMKEVKCAYCGNTTQQLVLGATSALGSPDLDTRPPIPHRCTIDTWIQFCPHCGYAYESIDKPSVITADFIKSDEYTANRGLPLLAEQFYRRALIAAEEKQPSKEYFAYLHAAWACDDAKHVDGAVMCRKKALEVIAAHKPKELMVLHENLHLMKIDLLRRTSQFDAVKAECNKLRCLNSLHQDIVQYQLKLACMKDTGCHKVQEARQ